MWITYKSYVIILRRCAKGVVSQCVSPGLGLVQYNCV